MTQDASSSSDWPNYHATLSDGTTTIPIVFSDGQGVEDITAFRLDSYPRTALKTSEGDSKYSDLEPPYFGIAQDDFTGGRGNEDFESDTSRYFDGHNVDTNKESGVVLTGRETYSSGYRLADFNMPGSVTFQELKDTTRYIAVKFTSSAAYTSYQCEIWVKRIDDPEDGLQVELWSESGGEPNAMLATKTIAVDTVTTDTVSLLKAFVWTGSPGLNGSSDFFVVIDGGSTATGGTWQIGCDAAAAGFRSADASSWTATAYSPYYRITPATDNFIGKFFEYKRGLYMVTQPDDADNSTLYINGDRGTADANTGALTTLIDGSKSWTNDEWIGCKVLLTKGDGSDESQNWREITDNDATTLTVSPAWNIVHDTSTEYVILGSDKWTSLVADLGDRVVDVAVADEYIYFTFGNESSLLMKRYRYYTSGGAWSTFNSAESVDRPDKILPIKTANGDSILYLAHNSLAQNTWGVALTKNYVPIGGQDYSLFYDQGSILPNSASSWRGTFDSNITYGHSEGSAKFTIGSSHTTGVVAIHNFDTPIDFTRSTGIRMLIKSTVATISTDMDLLFDDVENLGKTWSPVKVLKADYKYNRQPTKVYLLDEEGGAPPTYTDLTEAYDGIAATLEVVNVEDDDRILIGYSAPFKSVDVDLTVMNNVVADVAGFYFNGLGLSAVANISDTTETGSDTSMGVDGVISWDMPVEWVQQTINGVEAYWIHLTWTASLLATMSIARLGIKLVNTASVSPDYVDLSKSYDGDVTTRDFLTLGTEDYIYIAYSRRFNKIGVNLGTFSAEDGTMTAAYWNGSAWTSVTITDGTKDSTYTLEKDGDITFTIPEDWRSNTVDGDGAYWLRLDVSVALTTAFSINEITVTRSNNTSISLPALAANTWTWVNLSGISWVNGASIASMGIELDADKGAQSIFVNDVRLYSAGHLDEQVLPLPSSYRINGMELYSGNADDPVENPWIFTEKGVYELQTQNDDQVVPIPLKELATLQSSENGIGHTVNGTYLFFNIGEKVERYFNRTLDDVGPDRDEGLPATRQGTPVSMTSYPGRIFTAIDANTGKSSVLTMRGTAWSEVFRGRTTHRIRSVYLQAIPGTNVDRLWFSMGSDILWVPISLNPFNETDFTYHHEGRLITSWIYAGMMDVQKLWKSLKVFAENVGANYYIVVDYQKDVETTWTEIGTFDTAPVEEIDIASTIPAGKRIRFRLRFISNDVSESPRVKAIVTEGVAFVPVKDQYAFSFALKKGLERIDIDGLHDDSRTPAQDHATLRGWANDGQVLTFACQVPMADSKTVWINPNSLTPLRLVPDVDEEIYVCQLTAIEV